MFQGQTYRKNKLKKNVLEDGVLRVERSLVLGSITHEALLACNEVGFRLDSGWFRYGLVA
jgi:hypothetical protein